MRTVFVCDEEDGEGGVRVDGVDAEGGGGEVFGCGGGEGLVKGADEGGVLGFEGVGL